MSLVDCAELSNVSTNIAVAIFRVSGYWLGVFEGFIQTQVVGGGFDFQWCVMVMVKMISFRGTLSV